MARVPPLKMSYPCNECSFEAQSARQLSRHKAVTHVENALKCVLCPFVTAYQTNLLRHRREVHGICGSKGNKSCKFCGFLSEDNETLIRHQLEVHRDILKSAQVKFAKELVSAGGEDNSLNAGHQYGNNSDLVENHSQNQLEDESNVNRTQEEEDEDDDKNFWKEGFEDNGPNFYMNLAYHQSSRDHSDSNWYESSGQPSPPSHENSISEFVSSRASTPKFSKKMAIPASAGSDDLPATRIRRQYTCNDCGFRTINPREFLYHRRDAHGQRLKIVECPYCVYACQYVQKLQRHLLLVHKLETSMTPPPEVAQTSSKSSKSKAIPKAQTITKKESPDLSDEGAGTSQQNVVPKIRVKLPTLTSPAMVTTNQVSGPLPPPPKAKLVVNQKSVSDHKRKIALQRQISANQKRLNDKSIFAKKYHKCQTCGYMTNVQYLFKKHMKYHSAPKIKCEMCDFESPYSWNVDRHVRSHYSNGLFKCTKCSFACDKKQALTVHMTQHHRDKPNDKQTQEADPNQSDDKPLEDEAENEVNQNEDNEEAESGSLSHLFEATLEEGSAPTIRAPTTYVRGNDGKIVAKPGVVKKCKYCNFQTDTFAKLQKHESTAHPEKRFQCPLCEIKFENLVWLQRHLTHMHQEDTQANNIVTILEKLNPKRKRNNRGLTPGSTPLSHNIPELLNQSAKQPNVAMKRKQPVTDKSATQCQVCGYQTRWISELEKHMRVHTKERPFACPYCSFKSKWKGDLNRHIQKYHSRLPMPDLNLMEQQIQSHSDVSQNVSENSMEWNASQNAQLDSNPDFENDLSVLSGEVEYEDFDDNIEEIKMDDKPLPDDYEERPLVFDDLSDDNEENEDNTGVDMGDDDNENELHIDFDDKEGLVANETPRPTESPNEMTKSGKVKMYRCSYCDFTCSTASRFHVHFVQHLNTKPFQCSVCGHRSNWEWDVTKHIKMKSQRDPKHENAKAMLVHESGKRDYSKYNKYVVWVNQKEAIAGNTSNPKIDFRAKRARMETNDGVEYEDNEVNQTNETEYEEENNDYSCDPESIVITPDICFEVQGEEESTEPNVQYNKGFNPSLQPNVPYNSNTASDDTKLLQCSYCDFKHKESKVMVSHLSSHAGMKPYRCRRCGFDSNWREVVVRHCVARHQSNSEDVEQRFRCTVNKSFCKIVDDTVAPKSSVLSSTPNSNLPSAVQAFQESHQSVRISGFKGSFVCDLCPFRAEKAFHMDFHVKRHQPSSGPFKCPHCPYWVNAKKSLVKHMLLHADKDNDHNSNQNKRRGKTFEMESIKNNEMEDDMNDDMSENELIINEDNEQQKYFNQSNLNLSAVRQSASVSKNRCDKCPFIAGTKTQLLYHKQFHRPNRSAQYSCTLCTYSVSYLHLLNQHMKVHYQTSGDQMPINYYELPQEEESLMEESDDRDESDIPFTWVQIGNNKRKLFQCRFCSTTSKRRTYIYVHERLHTQNTNETFKCSHPNCLFVTRDSTQYLSHLNQHKSPSAEPQKEETPKLETNQTNLSTPSVSVIDVNSFRHGSRRMFSYVCPDCPAAFKSPGDLKIHSAFHNTEYDHHCFYCSYKAKNKPQLCKHLYVHTAEYIAKRANSYPDGTKLLIGNAVDHMKRDMRSPLKEGLVDDKRDNSSSFQSGATSLLKKSDKTDSSPQWTGIAKELNGGVIPKRAAMIGADGRSPREQMLLLEMTESNAYLEKLRTGVKHRFIYRCSHCPAVFMKVNTLTFHISMHGSEEPNKCKLCSYSTSSNNNLLVHQQLHNYSSFASLGHSVYNHRCGKCPAAFSKKSRLEKHITLHGLDAKWKCDQCDYAVHYAATLVKHRACHQMNPNFKVLPLENRDNHLETTELKEMEEKKSSNATDDDKKPSIDSPKASAPTSPQNNETVKEEKEEKILYCCDRCPYVHNRKDAVQSHLKRHDQQIRNVRDGKQCPYCDYTCLQPSYLREHIQWHFEPPHDRKPTLFTYWNNLEVWKLETIESDQKDGQKDDSENERKRLLFRDNGVKNDIKHRFEPPEDDPEFYELYESFVGIDSESEEEENEPPVSDLSETALMA